MKSEVNMTNSWWELQILCDPALEDSIFWRLEDFGSRGTASEGKGDLCLVKAYLPKLPGATLDLELLSSQLHEDALCVGSPIPTLSCELINEEDWATSWKQYWQPEKIGDRFLINPAWLPIPAAPERLVILLDPGVAFGTGNHATTQLCLESLEKVDFQGNSGQVIADIGCGSGILAIGALLLGAKTVYAVDTDPLAVQSTLSNRDLNRISPESLVPAEGSVDMVMQGLQKPVDGIVCNILADVIIQLLPQMSQMIKPSSWGIFSGILVEQSVTVAESLEKNGWIVDNLLTKKEWCCLNVRRSQS